MDAKLRKGILRVEAKGNRGTGFVVRRSDTELEIVTAFHVVGDLHASRSQGKAIWRDTTATVRPHTSVDLTVSLDGSVCDWNADWALLRYTGAVPDDVPHLPLADLRERTYKPAWSTFGFSDAAPASGEPHSGDVELIEADVIHLYGKQAAAGKGGLVAG